MLRFLHESGKVAYIMFLMTALEMFENLELLCMLFHFINFVDENDVFGKN